MYGSFYSIIRSIFAEYRSIGQVWSFTKEFASVLTSLTLLFVISIDEYCRARFKTICFMLKTHPLAPSNDFASSLLSLDKYF